MKSKTLLCIILCAVTLHAFSQTTRATSEQQHAWFLLNGSKKINPKFSILYDFQFRRDELGLSGQQLLLRTGLGYQINDQVQAVVGYCFVETYPYGDFPVANAFPEHRIWEQMQFKHAVGKVNMTHRYRLEQRMIGNAATGDFQPFRFENRARYMCKVTVPLKSWTKQKLVLNVFDEVFLNFGKNVARNTFDQNRLSANLGFVLNAKITVEAGYMNQTVEQRGVTSDYKNKFENNHTITLGLTVNF